MVAVKEYYPIDFGDRDATMSVRPKSERHKPTFDKGRTNFLEEARTLARFEHPSIVRVSRVFETNSTAYMVMRFEQGMSLEGWLRSLERSPSQNELDLLVAPLLDALEIMHAADFLHRDIAPDNIIVRADGTPVLLDFGAARRAVAEMSRSLTGIVKAGYSPHEQYASDGRLQGPWSDLYAFGATLYRAVTGKPPEESMLRVDEDSMRPAVEAARGDYRREFLAAIDACLKVRHAERPRSVAQLRPMLLGRASQPPRRAADQADAQVPEPTFGGAAGALAANGEEALARRCRRSRDPRRLVCGLRVPAPRHSRRLAGRPDRNCGRRLECSAQGGGAGPRAAGGPRSRAPPAEGAGGSRRAPSPSRGGGRPPPQGADRCRRGRGAAQGGGSGVPRRRRREERIAALEEARRNGRKAHRGEAQGGGARPARRHPQRHPTGRPRAQGAGGAQARPLLRRRRQRPRRGCPGEPRPLRREREQEGGSHAPPYRARQGQRRRLRSPGSRTPTRSRATSARSPSPRRPRSRQSRRSSRSPGRRRRTPERPKAQRAPSESRSAPRDSEACFNTCHAAGGNHWAQNRCNRRCGGG